MKVLSNITDVFEVEVLQKIQDAFSQATGLATITVDYRGNPVTEYSNFTDYCLKVREDCTCLDCCYRSDAHGGIESARSGEPSIYICHGGLVDVAVPIMVEGNYLGAILTGQVRIPEEEMTQLPMGASMALSDFADREDRDEIYKLKKNIKLTTFEQVKASADLLYAIANYIVEKQIVNMMQEELYEKDMQLMEEMKHRGEMETMLKEAELKALQSQINPHFLFNVLNTIGRLALIEKADKTQEMVYSFSDMMRYTLKRGNTDFVTLGEEIEHVKNYLSVQKMRLGNRLDYNVEMDVDCAKIFCPFMTVQPFVENALNHAIEPNVNGGRVEVTARKEDECVVVRIIDDGPGIPSAVLEDILQGKDVNPKDIKGTGTGIDNTNRRLKYYLGEDHGIRFNETVENGTEVIIRLPIRQASGKDGEDA